MIDFQQKRQIRKIFYSRITLVVLLIVVVFMVKQVYDIYEKEVVSKNNLDLVVKKYDGLKSREKMLSSEIDKLKTKEGLEGEIRDKFDVEKPGEQTVVIVDNADTKQSTSTSENKSVWQSIIGWFK